MGKANGEGHVVASRCPKCEDQHHPSVTCQGPFWIYAGACPHRLLLAPELGAVMHGEITIGGHTIGGTLSPAKKTEQEVSAAQ